MNINPKIELTTGSDNRKLKPKMPSLKPNCSRCHDLHLCSRRSSFSAIDDTGDSKGQPRWVTVAFNGILKDEREAEIEGKVKRHACARMG